MEKARVPHRGDLRRVSRREAQSPRCRSRNGNRLISAATATAKRTPPASRSTAAWPTTTTRCRTASSESRERSLTGSRRQRSAWNTTCPRAPNGRSDFMNDIVQAVQKRDGADALKDFDGIAFIYAGVKPPEVLRSSILWPHRASVKIGDKTWPYVIVPEGGERMNNISTLCHEFGHILGLPDLYARPENPGSEGAGVWTVMSNQARNGTAAALLRLVQGTARLAHARRDRSDGEAKAHPRPRRRRRSRVLQGPRATRRQRILPARKPAQDRLRRQPARGRTAHLARRGQPSHPRGIPRRGRPRRPARVSQLPCPGPAGTTTPSRPTPRPPAAPKWAAACR